MADTNVNAHKARVAELRQQADVLNGEADQLQELVDSIEPTEPTEKEPEIIEINFSKKGK